MKKVNKILFVFLMLFLVSGAFFLGGITGFDRGYAYCVFHRSSSEAYFTLRTLESIDSDKNDEAREQLEGRLDTFIVEYCSGLGNKHFLNFNITSHHDEEAIETLMGKVAAYRKIHKSKIVVPAVQKCINEVVTLYGSR